MKTTLIAIGLGIATTISSVAGETAMERYGNQVGRTAHNAADAVGKAAHKTYDGGKQWWDKNGDNVKAKTMVIRTKTGEAAKRAGAGTRDFFNGLKSGWRR